MAVRQIAVMTCDRCKAAEDIRNHHRGYEWAKIVAAQANGPKWIGSMRLDPKEAKDLCPGCIMELMQWWIAPCDRDGAEGGDANAAPVPQDRQARAEGIAQ